MYKQLMSRHDATQGYHLATYLGGFEMNNASAMRIFGWHINVTYNSATRKPFDIRKRGNLSLR